MSRKDKDSVRTNVIELIVGQRNTGKTEYTKKVNAGDKRVLYVMLLDHPKYRDLENVYRPDLWNDGRILQRWENGHIRIVGNETEAIFAAINKYVVNAKICFEDAAPYIPKRLPKEILRLLVDTKQKNNDIQLHYHGLFSVPGDIWLYADYLTLFKTKDVKARSGFIPPHIWPVHDQIMKHPSQYHRKTIELN